MNNAQKIQAAVDTIRKNADDYHAGRIGHERFTAVANATWGLVRATGGAVERGVNREINKGRGVK